RAADRSARRRPAVPDGHGPLGADRPRGLPRRNLHDITGGDMIVTRGLTKRFGRLTAVADLNLEVAAGQILGFLGPNGAGKTTTIRMLMGFLRPTAGHASILGARAGDIRVRGRIGYLPGDLRVDPTMTGAQPFAWYG